MTSHDQNFKNLILDATGARGATASGADAANCWR